MQCDMFILYPLVWDKNQIHFDKMKNEVEQQRCPCVNGLFSRTFFSLRPCSECCSESQTVLLCGLHLNA